MTKTAKFIDTVNRTVRQVTIKLQDRLGPFTEAAIVGIVGMLVVGALVILGIGSVDKWFSTLASFAAAAIIVFFVHKASRQNIILIEVTMSYLIHGGKPFLDHLLGKLIGGTWRREELRPGDALFNALQELSRGEDWEMKRRIAEALPALGEVDATRTMQIIGVLRDDWEPTKWKSDLRRRAVEAMTIPVASSRPALIGRVRPKLIEPMLRLRQGDEVFTAMAVTEALGEWGKMQPKSVERLHTDLIQFASSVYSLPEVEALRELSHLLLLSKNDNIVEVVDKIEMMARSPNYFVRIAASRNILLLSERMPDKALDLMLRFLNSSQHENVRRPIARERSMEFLIRMLSARAHEYVAIEILRMLLTDPDEIIRVTAFDKAEMLKKQDTPLLLEMCSLMLRSETSDTLRKRVERVSHDISGA